MTGNNPYASRVLVLGSTGLLGTTLVQHLKNQGFEIFASSRFAEEADIRFDPTEYSALSFALERVRPQFVLNLVGLTSVDECQTNSDLARKVNVSPNLNLAAARSTLPFEFRIVSISTDHLYDSPGESTEADISVLNVYALTKLQSELALDPSIDLVLRTNFVGKSLSPERESLTDWLWSRAARKESSSVIEDVYFSPLSMASVSNAVAHALTDYHSGVFNLGSKSGMSKAEFDFQFLRSLNLDISNFRPVRQSEAHFLVAPRPSDMRMDSSLFEDTFKLNLPDLSNEISHVVQEYIS